MLLFLTAGVCGGFTTLSTFIYEMFQLMQDSEYAYAARYLLLTVTGCAGMFYGGFLSIHWIMKG